MTENIGHEASPPSPPGQADNTSGRKCAPSELPPEARSLSWGAFFWGPLWGIVNSTWASLLCLVFPVIMNVVLLLKGKQWAWENRRWDDATQFEKAEKLWAKWGLIVFLAVNALLVALVVLLFRQSQSEVVPFVYPLF